MCRKSSQETQTLTSGTFFTLIVIMTPTHDSRRVTHLMDLTEVFRCNGIVDEKKNLVVLAYDYIPAVDIRGTLVTSEEMGSFLGQI